MVDAEYGLAASSMNNDDVKPVVVAFFMQKILQFSWLIGNDNLFHFNSKPPPFAWQSYNNPC